MNGSFLTQLSYLGQVTLCALCLLLIPWWPSQLLAAIIVLLLAVRWIKQSAAQRKCRRLWPNPPGPYPFWLYELRPFIYLLSGLLLGAWMPSWWWYPSAILLSCAGMLLWTVRILQR